MSNLPDTRFDNSSDEPEATTKQLFQRLQIGHPNVFTNGQLRTLQRRVKDWRAVMAKQLVFGSLCDDDGSETGGPAQRSSGDLSMDLQT